MELLQPFFSVVSEGQNVVLQRAGKLTEKTSRSVLKRRYWQYLKIWNAIEAYASQIIGLFYIDDAAVSGDKELQNFADDFHHNGFPAYGNSS